MAHFINALNPFDFRHTGFFDVRNLSNFNFFVIDDHGLPGKPSKNPPIVDMQRIETAAAHDQMPIITTLYLRERWWNEKHILITIAETMRDYQTKWFCMVLVGSPGRHNSASLCVAGFNKPEMAVLFKILLTDSVILSQ